MGQTEKSQRERGKRLTEKLICTYALPVVTDNRVVKDWGMVGTEWRGQWVKKETSAILSATKI